MISTLCLRGSGETSKRERDTHSIFCGERGFPGWLTDFAHSLNKKMLVILHWQVFLLVLCAFFWFCGGLSGNRWHLPFSLSVTSSLFPFLIS